MLHPLPTLAGDRAPFIPIKLVAFLSPLPPPPPSVAPSLPARSLGTSTNSHATRTSKLGCGSRRTSIAGCGGDAKAERCTDRWMQASASASFVGAIMWRRFVRTPSSQSLSREQKCTPSLRPRAPTLRLRRLYARVVVLLMCASLCHAHLAFCIDHREPSTLTLHVPLSQVPLLARRHIVVLIVASASPSCYLAPASQHAHLDFQLRRAFHCLCVRAGVVRAFVARIVLCASRPLRASSLNDALCHPHPSSSSSVVHSNGCG
jgi:hypothetical protein